MGKYPGLFSDLQKNGELGDYIKAGVDPVSPSIFAARHKEQAGTVVDKLCGLLEIVIVHNRPLVKKYPRINRAASAALFLSKNWHLQHHSVN